MAAINNELNYINQMAREDPQDMIGRSEARYRNIVGAIADRALRAQGHKLILLAGPSASGKTTSAKKIAGALKTAGVNTFYVSMDDFYLPAERIPLLPNGKRDIESVHALDLPLLRRTLRELMETGQGTLPRFDFATGTSREGITLKLGPEDMIVLEGLHALHPLLAEQLSGMHPAQLTKVYVSVSSRIYNEKEIVLNKRGIRLARRMLRDCQFRGTLPELTLGMWSAVTQGEEQYLAPCKPFADVFINSIHIYECCVYRARLLPLLNAIPEDSPVYGKGQKLARALERFEPLDGDLVPKDSLLREFLGTSGRS
ncbi:MAG: nucleoside kinase [Oscillospiraceae bacterium]|nr:nucleoside kinase [Oscillospiraceae bacterium]